MPGVAERERKARDLRGQIAGLDPGLEGEIAFQHIRTRRELVTLYSMADGEPIPVPEYMVAAAISKQLDDGRYMFTDNPDEAPEYRRGTVRCFLHADSSERASGVLDEIGLGAKTCPAGHLASAHSKRMHGQHRHHQEWEAYQEYLEEQKEEEREARQEKQLKATLAIAGKAAGSPVAAPKGECDICGKSFKNVGVHKSHAHKENGDGDSG